MNNYTFKLDNAAKIYPAAMTKNWNAVFRTAVYLKETVNRAVLDEAVQDLAERFPSFYVQLKEGKLWDSFVPAQNFDIVSLDMFGICNPFPVGRGRKPLFRVLYRDNMIAAEFFHSVTDGNGAMVYLKTLTAHYLELQGKKIEKTDGVLDINDSPKASELEDSFQGVYKKAKRVSRNEPNAYQYRPERSEKFHAISAVVCADELKAQAKKYDCTVTAYLAGVYAFAFLQHYKKEYSGKKMKRSVKISIPVNLRPYFESNTLRNFASFVNVSVNPNENNTLADTVKTVKSEMDQLIKIEKIKKTVSQNVAEEKMLITRITPNKIKKLVMKACFFQFGEKKYTAPFSNIGIIKVPQSMQKYIDRFEFVIGKTLVNSVYCTAAGFNNKISITLSSIAKSTEIEDLFLKTLKQSGLKFEIVKIGCKNKKFKQIKINKNKLLAA